MASFEYEGLVALADTDLAGVVYHANYLRYMEEAEHAFWRGATGSAMPVIEGTRYGWPRVHVSCDYRAPLRFEDAFSVRFFVTKVGTRSADFLHIVTRSEDGAVVARGRVTAVCMQFGKDDAFRAVAIPAELRDLLQVADPAEYEPYL